MMRKQTGFTLTEVNLSVVLATILVVPFIAFYGGTQRAFLQSYNSLNYLSKTKQVGEDITASIRRVDALAFNTANMAYPAPTVVGHQPTTDKHVQVTYTPYQGGAAQAPQALHYVYDEAAEQLWVERGANTQALTEKGMIKAFMIQYFDNNNPVTPSMPNPNNVRRAKVTLVSTPKAGFTIDKGVRITNGLISPQEDAGRPLVRRLKRRHPVNNKPMLDTGGVASATANTLTTSGLTAGYWNGGLLAITAGTGKGQKVGITTNTGTVFNVSPAFTTIPDNTSQYRVYVSDFEGTAESGVAVTTTPLTFGELDDNQKVWDTNEWVGYYLMITAGTGAGQSAKIVGNTATKLYLMDAFRQDGWNDTSATPVESAALTRFPIAPDATSRYMILPRFYATEEGKTSAVAANNFSIRDDKKVNRWQQTLYPYKNRPTADRNTRIYSAFFQGYALELTSGPDSGKVRPPITNTNAVPVTIDVRHSGGTYSAPVAAGTGYKLVRLGKSADMGAQLYAAGSNQYATPDHGLVSVDSAANNIITDGTKAWQPGAWVGGLMVFRMARDDNGGIIGYIETNTADSITFNTDAAAMPLTNPARDDKYILDPPDSMPVAGFSAKTITLEAPSPAGANYPQNYWEDGYIAIFNPASVATTYQIRKIMPREAADANNIVRVSNIAGTAGEDFNPVPTGAFRYRVFHKPLKQIPFTWMSEVKLRKVVDDAGVF